MIGVTTLCRRNEGEKRLFFLDTFILLISFVLTKRGGGERNEWAMSLVQGVFWGRLSRSCMLYLILKDEVRTCFFGTDIPSHGRIYLDIPVTRLVLTFFFCFI